MSLVTNSELLLDGGNDRQLFYIYIYPDRCVVLVLHVWRTEENHERDHDSWSASPSFKWEPMGYERYRHYTTDRT